MRFPDRRQDDVLAQLANIIDAVVARGILLDEVHRAALVERNAGLADIARLAIHRRLAVRGLCEETAECCLAGATRSAEEVCVGQIPRSKGVAESAGHECPGQRLRRSIGGATCGRGPRSRSQYRTMAGRQVIGACHPNVRVAKLGKDRALTHAHQALFFGLGVVVAAEVEDAVDEQVG